MPKRSRTRLRRRPYITKPLRQSYEIKKVISWGVQTVEEVKKKYGVKYGYDMVGDKRADDLVAEKIMQNIFIKLQLKPSERRKIETMLLDSNAPITGALLEKFEKSVDTYALAQREVQRRTKSDIYGNAIQVISTKLYLIKLRSGESS